MFYKFSLVIALAIFLTFTICNSEEIKDPNTFIQDSLAVLNTLKEECQNIDDDLEKVSDVAYKIDEFTNCGNKLLEIANSAAAYDLSKIENIETKETIKLLRNVEVRYKMGEYMQKVHSNLMPIHRGYLDADIESYDDSDLKYSLDEILKEKLITKTEDVNEMNYYWSEVSDKVGKLAIEHFFPTIDLIQKKAKDYNLNAAEFRYPNYSENIMTELENFIKKLKPLYQELHAYIRSKLYNRYGNGVVKTHGPIPEPLYQQIEDRVWSSENYYEQNFPLSNIPNFDEMYKTYHLKPSDIFRYAERYYESLGIENFDKKYWKDHIKFQDENCTEYFIDKHADNIMLNYCGDVTFKNFLSYTEYFGRIYGAIFQKDAPWLFWGNNFYGKIIGRAVRLAAATKSNQDELSSSFLDDDYEDWMLTRNINKAFEEVFDLMRRYVKIRVVIDLLTNKVNKVDVNKHYWTLFEEYAGVEPPIDRIDESLDLPYSLVYDLFNTNPIRDFEVKVHAFDVFEAACELSEHTGPLNECNFSYKKDVGKAFKEILSTGLKKPFTKVIEPLIPNYKYLNAKAILTYFQPAFERIRSYNMKHNLTTGWDQTTKKLNEKPLENMEEAKAFVEKSNGEIYKFYDEIAFDLFKMNEQFADEDDGELLWQRSEAAHAAINLTAISIKAKQYEKMKIKSKPLKKDISKLTRVADVFALRYDFQNLLHNKKQLQNTSIDTDIAKYKDTSDEPVTVAYNPYILNVFKTSKDPNELKYYWEAWRERNGAFVQELMRDILGALRNAANVLGISTTEFWYKHYSNNYIKKMEEIIVSIRPFYQKLHYYVSEKLVKKYSEDNFSWLHRSIPDHFVQQVLAQIWTNESIVEDDFPWHKLPPQEQGVTDKTYDAIKLLKTAEEFYQSLGFEPLEESFWNERLKAEEGSASDNNCHATIIDLTPTVYMKYCERVSFRKLLQAHGYLGRVHYAVEKRYLPSYYFDSYDLEYPVGEAVILSASSPKHVEKIGLFSDFKVTDEVLLNRLARMAIHTMFNLHKYFVHTKVIDEYLQGKIEEDKINKNYWKYMISYAGIEPPNDRNIDNVDFPFEFYTDLDQNHQVRKFTSEILGYRMYERLCNLSGHKGDLNNCDFFGSTEAGKALKSMMTVAYSLPRKTILKRFLQDASDLDANSLLTYYEPFQKWLNNEIKTIIPDSFDSYRKSVRTEYFDE